MSSDPRSLPDSEEHGCSPVGCLCLFIITFASLVLLSAVVRWLLM